jgi:hypothetical protein
MAGWQVRLDREVVTCVRIQAEAKPVEKIEVLLRKSKKRASSSIGFAD